MPKLQHTVDYLKIKDSKYKLRSSGPEHHIKQITKDRLKHSTLNRFKRAGDDEISREPIAIFHQIENNKEEKQELETLLSNLRTSYLSNGNLKIGAAVKNGDCFFDSVAQGLNELKDKGLIQSSERFNAKSLRKDCADYAQQYKGDKDSWLCKAVIKDAELGGYFVARKNPVYGGIMEDSQTGKAIMEESDTFNSYLKNIENIALENGPIPMWGRLNIEGKIICEKYNLKIEVIDLLDESLSDGRRIIKSEEGNGHNVVRILNYKKHFVPLLSKLETDITENVQVTKQEVYGVEDEKSPSLVENIGNYDLEEHNNQRGNQAELHFSGSSQSRLEQQLSGQQRLPLNHQGSLITVSDIYSRLTQVTFNNDDSGNPGVWAGIDQINSYINQAINSNEVELAYYIAPTNFAFDSEEGIKDIAKHLCKRNGINDFYGSNSELDKPFIIISNTVTVVAENPTDVNQQGGSHWISWILLPKKYKTLSGEEVNNNKYQVLFFDSLSQKSFPEGLKKFLTEGGEITEDTTKISLSPFCTKEEIDFKDLKDLTGQQMNGSDCGWWAVYYSLMTVYTGKVDFLEQLKGKKLSAIPLRTIMRLEEVQPLPIIQSFSESYEGNKQSKNQPQQPIRSAVEQQQSQKIKGSDSKTQPGTSNTNQGNQRDNTQPGSSDSKNTGSKSSNKSKTVSTKQSKQKPAKSSYQSALSIGSVEQQPDQTRKTSNSEPGPSNANQGNQPDVKGRQIIKGRRKSNNMKLLVAARTGNIDNIKPSISEGADVDFQDTEGGNTALHYAVKGGKLEVVKLLLDNKANVNIENNLKKTPLQVALSLFPEIVPNEVNNNLEVAICLLTRKDSLEVVNPKQRKLLEEYLVKFTHGDNLQLDKFLLLSLLSSNNQFENEYRKLYSDHNNPIYYDKQKRKYYYTDNSKKIFTGKQIILRKVKDLYLKVLSEIKYSMERGDIDRLKRIGVLATRITKFENHKAEKNYFLSTFYENENNLIRNTNLAILACKYNQLEILKYLFSREGNNLLNTLSKKISKSPINPADVDEEGHDVFYYAIRSGNVKLLETLIDKWPGNYFSSNPDKLNEVLSEVYKELKLKNVRLSENIKVFVEDKLANSNQESSQPDSHHHSGSDQRLEASRQVNHPVTQEITRLIREKSEDIFNDIKEQDRRARKIFNIEEQKPEYLLPLSERHYLILNGEISPILSDLQNQDVSAATTSREVNFSKVVNKLVINIIEKFDEVLGKKDKETKQKKLSDDKNFAFYLISNDKKITILLAISGFGNAGKKNYSKEYENCQTGLEEAIKEVTKSNAELNDYNIEGIFVPFTRKEEKVIAQPFKNIFTAVEKELDRSSDNFVKFSLIAKFLLGDIALNHHNANTVLKDITDYTRFIKAIKDCHQIKKQIKKREDKLDIGLELITIALLEQVSNEKNTEENTNEGRENDVIDIKANLKFLTKQSKSLHYFEEKTKIKEFLDSNKGNIISRYRESLRKFWKLFNDELRSSNIIKNDARCSEDNLMDYLSYNSDHLKKDGIHYIFSVKRGEKEKKETQPISIRPPCSYCILHFPLEFQAIAAHKTGLPVFTFEQRLELQFPTNKLQYMNLLLNMGFSHTENFLIKLIESLNPISVIKMLTKYNKLVVQMGYGNMISVLENLSSKLEILGSEFEDIKIQVHQLFSTLLFYATEAGSQDVVKFLIDKGASIDKEKEHKLLRKAIINGNYKVVQALLEDRTVEKKIEMIKTEDDMPPLYLAASFKRPEIFKLLVNNIPEKHRLEVIRLKPTLLKKATVEFIPPDNYVNILDKLYKNLDTYLWEPLFAAIYSSNFEMVKFIWEELKKGGIKPEQLTVNDREPELPLTPLYIAVMRGDYEIVEYLINEGFLIEYDFKYTALNIAVALGREQIAILLMERMSEDSIKKSIENKWEKSKFTILHGLSEFGLHGLITHKRLESELKQHVNNKAILFKNNIEEDKDITPLHLASAYGYEKIVTWLLINRAGVNDYTEKGFTSLHLAAQSGHKKVVNDLLEGGAKVKVNDKTFKGFTPLHLAAQDGHEDVVYTLLKAGADVNDSTYKGFTPLHFAANDGYKDVVEVLLNNGANVNDAVSEGLFKGFTPLHFAALKGHKNVVQGLLKRGADVNARSSKDETPLHLAVTSGYKNVVEALLNKGANVNAKVTIVLARASQNLPKNLHKKEVYKQIVQILESTQALFTVIQRDESDKEQKIKQLKDSIENGGIVDATDNDDGLRLLHFSAREGDIEITKLLLEHGAVYNILGGKSKKTPLQMCKDNSRFSRSNHPKVTLLLEKIVELFDAIENNALEEVTRIIESTKELTFTRAVINAQNESEETPLHFAVKKGHKEVVQTLLNNGADVNTRMKDKTPLHLASEFGQNEIVIMLLRKGANIDAVNDKGFTPLHLAAENGYKAVVETLLGNGADIDALNDKDFTPLHLAAKNGYKAVVETLLGNGADIDTVNDKDFTPLHLAVENNHNDVVKVLLRNGANIETTDINGKKPLSYATANDGYDGSIKEVLELTGKLFTTIRGNLSKNTKVKNLKVYIKNGGVIGATDSKGNTVLHLSIREDLNEVSKLLLVHAKGCLSSSEFKKFINTINRESREEFAPLHYAAKKGDEEMVKLLLENGAIPNIEGKFINNLGKKEIKTPLDLVPENKEDIRERLTVGEVIENLLIEVDKCLGASSGNSERRKREAVECELSWNDDIKKIREGEEDIRDISKFRINSDKFIDYIKSISENKRTQLIQLAEQVPITGKYQGLVNKLISNQKFINHLSKVGMISGMTMQGMMAKNVLADAVNGNYQGLAINLGFIVLPFGVKAGENAALKGLHSASEIAYARGFKLAPLVELSLAQSFKLSSSFLARSTSAFIAYDLYKSVKELRNGTEEALVSVVGDSVYLGVDAAELGIEVAEGFGVLEGVSSVTGPIGATIGAVVFVGTDVYQAVKKVENIDRLVHLTAEERFLEGIRAFIGIKSERHIEELIEKKQLYNQLVKQALEYLKQHNDIQRYVFPTGKLVQDICSMVQYKEQCPSLDVHSDFMVMPGEPTGLGIRNACHKDKNGNLFILKEREECTTKFQHDSDNTVILDEQKPDIKWSKIRPTEGNLFCIPQGHGRLAPGLSYSCNNAIGVEYASNRTGNYTFIDLGDGTDHARGFKDSNNIFFIGNGYKSIFGGEKDDTFILQGNRCEGEIYGRNGANTLDLSKFSPQSKSLSLIFSGNKLLNLGVMIDQISKVITRENKKDIISCDVSLKYIDGRGGENENEQDIITVNSGNYLSGKFIPKVQIMLRDYTIVNNRASKGNFSYFVDQKEGKSSVDILSTSKNDFIFNNTLEDIKAINFNSSVDIRTVRFTFSPHNTEALISYRVQNISFTLKDGTVISVSKEGNLYALQNSNKSVDEIINSYSRVANNLKMSIFVHSLLNNESIVVGHGKHDVIENNPEYKSHLVGNGGENIFVVTSDKLPIPEIVLYDVDQENKIDTLDLRKVRKQVESDLNVKVKTRIVTSGKDLIIQLFYEKDNETSESNIVQVRLKNGLLTNWYERLHVIMNHVPMKIEEFELRPLPLIFDNNEEIIRIAAEDVDKNNKLIISQKIEDYTFSKLGNDLVMTFNHNASLILSEFYKNKEMETLTIRFANKEVAIKDELNNVRSFDDLKEEYKNSTASIINSFNTTEASNFTEISIEPLTVMRRNRRDIEGNVKSAASRPTSFINTIASTFANAMMSVIQGVSQFISAEKHSSAHMSSQPVQMGDTNSTLLLLDVFIRKITGEKYVSLAEQSISPSQARAYALSITDSFEKVLRKSAKSSECAISKMDFYWFNKLFRSIEGSMISGQYSKVPRILYESAESVCTNPSEKFFSDVERNIERMLSDMVEKNSLSLEKRSTTPLASLSNIDIEPVNRRRAIG